MQTAKYKDPANPETLNRHYQDDLRVLACCKNMTLSRKELEFGLTTVSAATRSCETRVTCLICAKVISYSISNLRSGALSASLGKPFLVRERRTQREFQVTRVGKLGTDASGFPWERRCSHPYLLSALWEGKLINKGNGRC